MHLHAKEIEKRRTFAIISHPDAGKTTLTEKFLLYGGAIREAGSVKSRRSNKHAVSDWMEIEKQRGISVTSSVLQFNYDGYCINILDTPGHEDFSEDTYRTLVAADNAVMVIDCAKGVEAQTKKLFRVCQLRNIPIFTFINKLDRQGQDPYELLEDLENALGIRGCPMNWPIGMGKDFKGVYNREREIVQLFSAGNHGQSKTEDRVLSINDPSIESIIGPSLYAQLMDDIELLDEAGDPYDLEKILNGDLTPVFFGSALTNFGIEPFLEDFLKISTLPKPRKSNNGPVDPKGNSFTGFIFKIQANMNPNHRDRIAFLRICSGKFEKGMMVNHVQKGKKIKLAQPTQFMAQDRSIVEEAYSGDIIGLHDPGIYNIGDTLCEDNTDLRFADIPQFAPEHFMKISTVNAMKRKQFLKGILQLSEEGSIQIYKRPFTGSEEIIIGVVGALQFEVLEYRLNNEYNVEITKQLLPHHYIRWIDMENFDSSKFKGTMDSLLVYSEKDAPVALFQYEWSIKQTLDKNKGLILRETSTNFD
jgi:peptide chain release factor 3